MPANAFQYFSLTELAELRAAYKACILAVAQGAQSYSANNITVTRAGLDAAKQTLLEIESAIRLQNGDAVTRAHPITRPRF